ncbi:YfjI family protein [Amphritea sp. HPY]|uniref:YfjI family protein n=1 Tax=Amphritea sp. HPY TaxID=3421652 RepID=UPI003D7CEA2A
MTDTKDILSQPESTIEKPLPLKSEFPKVEKLTRDMLPNKLCDYVFDVAERTQCPPEYVAISAIIVLSAVVGNKYAIRPKQNDDWEIRINQWGALIGPPSAMKSPALKDATRAIHELEKENADKLKVDTEKYKVFSKLAKADITEATKQAETLFREGKREEAFSTIKDAEFNEELASMHRYVVNDATVEKLGELLNENPNGLLLLRDELSGFLAKLSQEDSQVERAFYLECFDGDGRFTYDRIGRGTIAIENCTLSVLGGIQPSKIARLISLAKSGHADDGLVQRLQLAVWPDIGANWKWKDQAPHAEAYEAYRSLVRDFHAMQSAGKEGPTVLRFSPEAQALFAKWMEELHADIRNGDYHPIAESHFTKSPKTITAIALLFELIDGARTDVSKESLLRALTWAPFLQSHALRIYSISNSSAMDSAKLILKRRSGLNPIFTVRDIRRKGWAALTESSDIQDAINCLLDHNYLIEMNRPSGPSGGRPTKHFRWNPALE